MKYSHLYPGRGLLSRMYTEYRVCFESKDRKHAGSLGLYHRRSGAQTARNAFLHAGYWSVLQRRDVTDWYEVALWDVDGNTV